MFKGKNWPRNAGTQGLSLGRKRMPSFDPNSGIMTREPAFHSETHRSIKVSERMSLTLTSPSSFILGPNTHFSGIDGDPTGPRPDMERGGEKEMCPEDWLPRKWIGHRFRRIASSRRTERKCNPRRAGRAQIL